MASNKEFDIIMQYMESLNNTIKEMSKTSREQGNQIIKSLTRTEGQDTRIKRLEDKIDSVVRNTTIIQSLPKLLIAFISAIAGTGAVVYWFVTTFLASSL